MGDVQRIRTSIPGSQSKPAMVSLHRQTDGVLSTPPGVHVVVVAIRGTASIDDWMVNFNSGSRPGSPVEDTDSFLVFSSRLTCLSSRC